MLNMVDAVRYLQHDMMDADHRSRCADCRDAAAIVTLEDAYALTKRYEPLSDATIDRLYRANGVAQ